MRFPKYTLIVAILVTFWRPAMADFFANMAACADQPSSQARITCVKQMRAEELREKEKKKKPAGGGGKSGGGGGGGGGRPSQSVGRPNKANDYSLKAETRIEGPIYSFRPALHLRCRDSDMHGYVEVGMEAVPDRVGRSGARFTDAIFQIDDSRAFREEMRVSQDGNRLYFHSSVAFSKKLLGKQQLTFQFTPLNADSTSAEFDVAGFEEAVATLRKNCKW